MHGGMEVPVHVQDFLRTLDPEEVKILQDAIKLMQAAKTLGRLGRWLVLGMLAAFTFAVSNYEHFVRIKSWMTGMAR